jgi:hypothetical protein
MAVKIDIPGFGEVTAENFAQEDTLQKLLAVMSKSDKAKRQDETKRIAQEKELAKLKKEEEAQLKKSTAQEAKAQSELDKLITGYKEGSSTVKTFGEDMSAVGEEVSNAFADVTVAVGNLAGKFLRNYDAMVTDPIKAGAGILETANNIVASIAHIGVKIGVALGKAAVGWVPFIGTGLADAVDALGVLGDTIIDFASQIFSTVNTILENEFQKRARQLFSFMTIGGSFAGGMSEMGQLATQSGIGIDTFTKAVVAARPYITDMGLTVGDATRLLSKNMAALGTTMGKGGKTVRDELLALGYNYEQQGVVMAQYMAQLKTTGVNLQAMAPAQLATLTEEYAKHLKVLSDITGQNAQQLMDQARAEAQRGALMDSLTATQSRAFQDAYATLAAMPGQQGPKLQAALAQVLAGGVVTDPVIAGNKIIMDMLKQTASQVSAGNINMVTATQANLGKAAEAYRSAGESATDFATLMNPSGTSAVAQGMSTFGNALRQYRYDPTAAEASMTAADGQAAASDGLTSSYVSLTGTMNDFQNAMEALAQEALPTYAKVMASAAANTAGFVTTGIKLVLGQIGLLQAFSQITGINLNVPGLNSVMGGTAPSAADVQNTGSGAGSSLASAQSSSTQAPTKGQAGSLDGTYAPPPPKAAAGGILSGPVSGFAAELHGTEAVVPLPDGKTIPVEVSTSNANQPMASENTFKNLTSAVNQQTGVLNQILSSMNKNNSLTSGILQASM